MSDTVYPLDNMPKEGTLTSLKNNLTDSSGNWLGVNDSDWQLIDSYDLTNDSGITSLQIMLSSDYPSYKNGSYYYLKVVDPNLTSYSTDTKMGGNISVNGTDSFGNSNSGQYRNENSVNFSNPTSGTYKIYGAYYNKDNSLIDVPYNMMVLSSPKRLGQGTPADNNSAAKVAGSLFVSMVKNHNNRIGIVWFNNSIPMANFTSSVTDLTAQFYDVSITSKGNNITGWVWNFGDKTNSSLQNPVHTYAHNGNFTVTLTVMSDGGINTTHNYVTVYDPLPIASFTASPTIGYSPLAVQFTDTTVGNGITWRQWNFGDGTGNNTSVNPLHTFVNTNTTNATYTVYLTVNNDGGNSTATPLNITVVPQIPDR